MVVMPTEGDAPDMALADAVTLDDVRAAAARIGPHVHRTRVRTSRTLDEMLGATGLVKCENEQRVGAFKFRGACNALARLTPDQRSAGVLAYSSGNHAQGVALAAGIMGVPAVIVMPADAPGVKLAATRGYGAEVVTYERGREVREEVGARLAAARGLAAAPRGAQEGAMRGTDARAARARVAESRGRAERGKRRLRGESALGGGATIRRSAVRPPEAGFGGAGGAAFSA